MNINKFIRKTDIGTIICDSGIFAKNVVTNQITITA